MILSERGCGVLLHLTSLPSRYGVGDMGPAAREFVDLLVRGGQRCWQFLPLCPTSSGLDNSPYMGLSAFAGNPLLISPEALVDDGLLEGDFLAGAPPFSDYLVDYDGVRLWKEELLAAAFNNFQPPDPGGELGGEYADFLANTPWLDDYALFMSLREKFNKAPWYAWPPEIAARDASALEEQRLSLARRIDYHRFVQFTFHRQWKALRHHANQRGVKLVGDIPIYVAPDSADVWAMADCFYLDPETRQPVCVAGVPPDYFSETGQRWGNPLFRWEEGRGKKRERLYQWWSDRLSQQLWFADIIRIDHFRGFEAYWEVPAREPDAIKGRWVKGPGIKFFKEMRKRLGRLPIIAEDLGVITPAVEKLRDDLGFPGMKVLQFAFDSDETNAYLPHNYPHHNCVVYTGTHDNDTVVGWFLSDKITPEARERVRRYARSGEESPINRDLIGIALASVANLVIIPLQDILGFGGDCRMNLPGTAQGNWRWRVAPGFLNEDIFIRLRAECEFYNRYNRHAAS